MPTYEVMRKEHLADLETPISVFLKLCPEARDSFLLESVETKDITGRYSIVAFDPLFGCELHLDRLVSWNGSGKHASEPAAFFELLKNHLRNPTVQPLPGCPAVGSLMGFIGYDAVGLIEKLPTPKPSDLPIARLVFPSRFVVFDHVRRSMDLIAVAQTRDECSSKIQDMEAALRQPLQVRPRSSRFSFVSPPKDRFCTSVEKAKEYIRAGDIFQVVLADAFHGETDLDPFEVYRRLRMTSPSPYMFYLNFGDYRLMGASPETLVRVENGMVTVRPIAGTRGRSASVKRDRELEQELMESDKEGAEHLMLVDLARNDVGRVATYGSVNVDPFRTVERYSHVMHIVSQVQGELREGLDPVDAFMAAFPAGTVSGAPKVRAMEIIHELETEARGPYAGAVGYFGPPAVMDTCIAIRSILFRGNRFEIRVGAGIVADSIPEMEFKEITNKAAQSVRALEAAASEGTK
jgi:anthranilate synthase component I